MPAHHYGAEGSTPTACSVHGFICHPTHPPLSQRAQGRAEGEGRLSGSPLARGRLRGSGFFLRGLGRTGGGFDVEVLQDVVVDFGGDLLLLQHLPDGLVGGVGADGRAILRGHPSLRGTKAELWFQNISQTGSSFFKQSRGAAR